MSALSRIAPTLSMSRALGYQTYRQMASVTATEPIQKIFVDKIREFKATNKGLDDAHKKAEVEEITRLKRVFKIDDETKIGQLGHKFPNEVHVLLHDLDETKELRDKIHSGEYQKQLIATPKPVSELLATIPPQVQEDMHLPPSNKPSTEIFHVDKTILEPVGIGEAQPDFNIVTTKVTPEMIEEEFMVEFGKNMPTIHDEANPERDVVNFPRISIPQNQPPTRYHFIPESWFRIFYPKTGVSGPYVYAGSLAMFLYSKEFLVMEHEMLTVFSTTILFTAAVIKFGPMARKWVNGLVKERCDTLDNWQQGNISTLSQLQENYKKQMKKSELINELYSIREHDIDIQLQVEHRNRLKNIYLDTKRRLDYLVSVADSKRQIAHKNLVNWVISNSVSSIGPKQDGEVLDHCITNLKQMASKNANVV